MSSRMAVVRHNIFLCIRMFFRKVNLTVYLLIAGTTVLEPPAELFPGPPQQTPIGRPFLLFL